MHRASPARHRVLRLTTGLAVGALGLCLLLGSPALANSRIKDIVNVQGVRDNELVGYGLVVGLNGTGDSLRNIPFTEDCLSHARAAGRQHRGRTSRPRTSPP